MWRRENTQTINFSKTLSRVAAKKKKKIPFFYNSIPGVATGVDVPQESGMFGMIAFKGYYTHALSEFYHFPCFWSLPLSVVKVSGSAVYMFIAYLY